MSETPMDSAMIFRTQQSGCHTIGRKDPSFLFRSHSTEEPGVTHAKLANWELIGLGLHLTGKTPANIRDPRHKH
jgi:hypothetical protein